MSFKSFFKSLQKTLIIVLCGILGFICYKLYFIDKDFFAIGVVISAVTLIYYSIDKSNLGATIQFAQKMITFLFYAILAFVCYKLYFIHIIPFIVGIVSVVALTLYDGIFFVEGATFGIIKRFGARIPNSLKERPFGFPYFKIPFVDQVDVFDYRLTTQVVGNKSNKELQLALFSKDRLEISVEGSLQYRADPDVVDRLGRSRFFELDVKTIEDGIADAVEQELGEIAGIENADTFIQKRTALKLLINSILRLEILPHRDPNHPFKDKDGKPIELKFTTTSKPALDKPLDPEHWINFYIENASQVEKILKDSEANSEIESRYGIEILSFALTDVDFSEKTKESFEAERRATAAADAETIKYNAVKIRAIKRAEIIKAAQAANTTIPIGKIIEGVDTDLGLQEKPIVKTFGLSADTAAAIEALGRNMRRRRP